jgi:hypothetical protein
LVPPNQSQLAPNRGKVPTRTSTGEPTWPNNTPGDDNGSKVKARRIVSQRLRRYYLSLLEMVEPGTEDFFEAAMRRADGAQITEHNTITRS